MGFFSAIKKIFGAKPGAGDDNSLAPGGKGDEAVSESPVQEEIGESAPAGGAEEANVLEAALAEEAGSGRGDEIAPEMAEAAEKITEPQTDEIVGEIISEKTEEDIPRREAEILGKEIDIIQREIEIIGEDSGAETAEAREEKAESEEAAGEEASAPAFSGGGMAEKAERPDQPLDSLETPEKAAVEAAMLARLRHAEPRLSAWLEIILEGVEETGALLWDRLNFLLRSLEAPEGEIESFVGDFRRWLAKMEYVHVDEFRSELQYRLALALDLEDEEDERGRLLLKLGEGLAKTREKFGQRLNELFSSRGELDQAFWDELEELFIMADLGYETSVEMVERLQRRARKEKVVRAEDARRLLREEMEDIFREEKRIRAVNTPEVILMIGVNGVGKTTTIAKLAHRERMRGKKVLIAAADTFRAAAIEQLQVWADRVGADFYAGKQGADPASVAWGALEAGQKNKVDQIYIDTAGRLQTKANLMEELGKIRQVLAKKHPGAPHRSILVLDATTGQNALSQARLFKEAAGADELILTKLDGTAKGGVAIAVAMRENLPITYVGLGEKMEDLRPFNGADYADALFGDRPA